MSKKKNSVRRFITPRRCAFTFIEVLLVLAIIALFCVCIFGFFLSGKHEPLKPPVLKPAAKAKPQPATPAPAAAATPVPPAPVPPAPPAEPAP